jgi:hypothetical protein
MAPQGVRIWTRRYSCGASGQITQYSEREFSVAVYSPAPDVDWSGGVSESLAMAVTLANGLAGEASTEATWVQISGEPLRATARSIPERSTLASAGSRKRQRGSLQPCHPRAGAAEEARPACTDRPCNG